MGLAYGSKPTRKNPKNEGTIKESILDDDELDADDVDADHDNLQFVAEQLEEIVRNYTNYSKETDIRFHLKKGAMNVHTLLQKMFIQELDVTNAEMKTEDKAPGMTDPPKHFDSFN